MSYKICKKLDILLCNNCLRIKTFGQASSPLGYHIWVMIIITFHWYFHFVMFLEHR